MPRARRLSVAVDVVALAYRGGTLVVLVRRGSDWALPWDGPRDGESLDACARRIASEALGISTIGLLQAGGVADARAHPGNAQISVTYAVFVGSDTAPTARSTGDTEWAVVDGLPDLPPRHDDAITCALDAIRVRLADSPVAFQLLPHEFTLSELQSVYETLLGRSLHKASFRRSLQAAALVEPLEEWRIEGRGRPAQLHRYAPGELNGGRRTLRFEFAMG